MEMKFGGKNQDGRQVRLLLSGRLVRTRRSCWMRLSSGFASTVVCVRLVGIQKVGLSLLRAKFPGGDATGESGF